MIAMHLAAMATLIGFQSAGVTGAPGAAQPTAQWGSGYVSSGVWLPPGSHVHVSPDMDALGELMGRASVIADNARATEREGRAGEAEMLFRSAIDVDRGCQEAWSGLARVLERQGKFGQALRAYRQLVYGDEALHDMPPDTSRLPGSIAEREARSRYLFPTVSSAVRMRYVLALLRAGQSQEAAAVYNGTLRAEAKRRTAEYAMRKAYVIGIMATGDPTKLKEARAYAAQPHARTELDGLVEVDPRQFEPGALAAAAHLVVAQSDMDPRLFITDPDALKEKLYHAERAVRLQPGCALAHHVHGLALESVGRIRQAAAAFRRALDLAGADRELKAEAQRGYDRVKPF